MNDLISRQTVLRCIKESRDDIDWGQSEDGDAFLHYSAALYRTVASKECVPAADVVPVVHGEWKPHEDKQMAFGLTFECSCCGSIVLVNDALEFGYCPYCGAKMDGERKE